MQLVSGDTYRVKIDNLNPGKRYLIALIPVNGLSQEYSGGDQESEKAKANVKQFTSCT